VKDPEDAHQVVSANTDAALQVVATAGHVDHGKSSLIVRLTGIDPDRWAEEKRRGLTIDLGFAWCTLPSGREVGFVDVPGHERFVRNMLAGVGPVRLVLFVVAADEGWKPQSEEHLAIVDVLGVHGGVVALTKCDLVDSESLDLAVLDVRERLAGTALHDAPIVPCSAVTEEGVAELVGALDAMLSAAPDPPRDERPRQFVDRVFSMRGAGTVITGTLTGGPLSVGDEVEVYPTRVHARIRGLQTHRRSIPTARPISRVAANLSATPRESLQRGDVVGIPGQWRPTRVVEAVVRPVRGLTHTLTGRGAYKIYAGAAERDAKIRFYGTAGASPAGTFARIRLSAPLVLDFMDRFVLREAGRRETVAGGIVLDPAPPLRQGPDAQRRLAAREHASREHLPSLLIEERGAIRASEVAVLTGLSTWDLSGAVQARDWLVTEPLHDAVRSSVEGALLAYHTDHPLREGADLSLVRGAVATALEGAGAPAGPDLIEALLDDLSTRRVLVRAGSTVWAAGHRVSLDEQKDEVDRLLEAVAAGEPTPPTISELQAAGFSREVIEAAARARVLVRVSPELVMTAEFVTRAEDVLRAEAHAKGGITVSAFRERLGTSRKFALPLLEFFDQRGVTRRQGDVRVLRSAGP
jgi:selenocysteine-specific elongation factor